jgi:transcription elongation GreA/GreB family factor
MKARWDDLRRAIAAKDTDGAERIWLELLETDLTNVDRYFQAAQDVAAQQGGKREAGTLLWMLAESVKEKGLDRELVRVYGRLAATGPDDGKIRTGMIEAARRAYADRKDLESLLEKSGMLTGTAPELAEQVKSLERYLRLEPGAFVFHKSGWGVGKIVEYAPDRARCVIDFRGRAGHEMDIEAAASLLERLPENDIRVLAMSDPKGLRALSKEKPDEVVRQVLARFHGNAALRHLKDALVPDAVAPSQWSEWWKTAKKALLLDPRFKVGSGHDPRIEFHEGAQVDFKAQVILTLKAAATSAARLTAVKELRRTVGDDSEAKRILREAAEKEMGAVNDPGLRMGWSLVLADLGGENRTQALGATLTGSADPVKLLQDIAQDETRAAAAQGVLETRPDGAEIVLKVALSDDPVVADVGAAGFAAAGKAQFLEQVLKKIEEAPVALPNLYTWYLKGLRRSRWSGRSWEPYQVVQRALKVLDAVEYRARREGSARDKKAVASLADYLGEKSCAAVQEAAQATDDSGAAYLLRILERNRGLKPRLLQKLQDTILRVHPTALRFAAPPPDPDGEAAAQRIYMTRSGLEKLKGDYDRIVNEEIPANAVEIARAREFGDLSENAEYHAAREKGSLLNARSAAIRDNLARAVPITPEIVRTDAVSVGTCVRLRDAGGKELSYTLLGPPDVDVERGIVSYLTPLGQALMGRRPGERVRVDVGGQVRDLQVLEIEKAPLP